MEVACLALVEAPLLILSVNLRDRGREKDRFDSGCTSLERLSEVNEQHLQSALVYIHLTDYIRELPCIWKVCEKKE